MVPILEEENKLGLKAARGDSDATKEFFVAFSPEREDPGNTTVARRDIPKVVGGVKPAGLGVGGRALRIDLPAHGSSVLAGRGRDDQAAGKYLSLCKHRSGQRVEAALPAHGLDIWEVIEAASTKPFGFHPFYPGPGLGGHCIPVDPFYLSWKAKGMGFPHSLHRTGGRDQHQHAVSRAGLHRQRAERS